MTTARLARLRDRMTEQNLDAMLILGPVNRAYMSGFTGSAGALLISKADALLFTDFRYTDQAAAQAPAFVVRQPERSISESVNAACQELHVRRIGFEGNFITVDDRPLFEDASGERELLSATGLVESLRTIKDADEVAAMRQAARIADQAWAQMLAHIRAGVEERELAVELEYRMKKLGAEALSFDIIVASGVRSALPHGRASAKTIEQGDLVTFDFGCVYQGYCSDMTRTVMVGEPTAKQREIYEIVLESQVRGVAACRPGMTGKELDEVCRSYIREKGFAEAFGHGTGHGVGRDIHEKPGVNARSDQELAAGMVVTIEPGIYLSGWGGVRIEDMVLVTADGCERLSQSPKGLLVL